AHQKVVKRKNAWPAGNDNEKTSGPNAVDRPGIGIDENFNDRSHDEESNRCNTARKTQNQQYWEKMLAERSDLRGQRRINQRQRILITKQGNRIFCYMPILDLGLTRPPEHGSRKDPRRERNQRLRNLVQNGG